MKSVHILLVEDNEGDILLTREALAEGKVANTTTVVRNGKHAIDYLFQTGDFEEATPPDLVLLDVNLPLKSGHEVLQAIKESEQTRHIPVIMLTTSSSERDIKLSYEHHANCYITKPVDVDEFLSAVCSIEEFWFNLVRLPRED
ncbi:MAG: response regulator [Bacteroidota bacterium]